jgi:sigma-B regulation protein RsbU (phosphoserine phosphatase)
MNQNAPAKAPFRLLLADDQPDVLSALRLLLKGDGFATESVTSPGELLRAASSSRFDLILMDLNYTRDTTSGAEGLELLSRLKNIPEAPPAVVMTAWSSIDLAVEAMRRGAVDFITKPWDNQRLVSTVRKSLRAVWRGDELSIARQVQNKLFPERIPRLKTLDIAGICIEAGAVGGDYYDLLDLGPGRLGMVLADVCGKGMGAALLMASLQATIRSHLRQPPEDWPAVLMSINDLFYRNTNPEHFATAFLADYNDSTSALRYVNCGHNPPIVLRSGGQLDRLEPTATVLGAFRRFQCSAESVRLNAGDWLVVFSDGVIEMAGRRDEFYGEQRLIELVRENSRGSMEQMRLAIQESLEAFASPAGRDDWTLLLGKALD